MAASARGCVKCASLQRRLHAICQAGTEVSATGLRHRSHCPQAQPELLLIRDHLNTVRLGGMVGVFACMCMYNT